jgi:hypothetical protein
MAKNVRRCTKIFTPHDVLSNNVYNINILQFAFIGTTFANPLMWAFNFEVSMNVLEGRRELKRMGTRSLLMLVANQRISNCVIGAKACGFSVQHQEIHFCVSELTGNGCPVERLEQSDQLYPEKEEINGILPIFGKMETELLSVGKKPIKFKVYHRDDLTRSIVYLGTVIERRRKERGNNLKDLLKKAIKEYSDCVENPSKIFLLGN